MVQKGKLGHVSCQQIELWHILQFQLLSLLKSIIENASKSSMKSSFLLFKIFTFEKQAPICTLGVGGKPLEMGCCCCCCFKGSPLRLPEFSMPVGDDLRADLSRRRGGALGEVLDPSSEKETQEIIFPVYYPILVSVSRCLKIIENVSSNIASEASYTFWLDQKS